MGLKLQLKTGGHHLVGLMNGGYIELVFMGIINQKKSGLVGIYHLEEFVSCWGGAVHLSH